MLQLLSLFLIGKYQTMTISVWLSYAKNKLETAGISTARLDSQLLLADILRHDRSWLMAHMDTVVTDATRKELDKQLDERARHVPLAYIRGKTEFYGREFYVDKRVLEPRPESETMINILKRIPGTDEQAEIIDVGTGSGALAITAKLELPKAKVIATDIDSGCLQVAEKNAARYHVNIEFAHGDLLDPIEEIPGLSIITLANLPYVPDDHFVNQAAMQEPRLAIFGGADGLDPYRKLFSQASGFNEKPRYILTESLPPQHKQLAIIAARYGFRQSQEDDFIQVFKGGHQQGVAYGSSSFGTS